MTSSLGAPLDPKAVKPVSGSYVNKHSASHLDCLVGGHEVINKENFEVEVKTFIDKIRPLKIVSFPGLNTKKLLGAVWTDSTKPILKFPYYLTPSKVPGGSFINKTISSIVQNCNDTKYVGFIYGSNNRNYFDTKLPAKEAVKMLFKELNLILQKTKFETAFISTIFPREADTNENGELITNIREFNDILLNPKSKQQEDFKICIDLENGEKRVMKWEVVDMTGILPYHDIRNEVYFCEQNQHKIYKDKIHVNGKILCKFYKKLDTTIRKSKIKMHHYKNKNSRKKRKISQVTT